MIGQHHIKSWAKGQHAVSLSSAEAELYAAVKGASEMIGLAAIARDMGFEANLVLGIDASAAIGLLNREGLGRAKHIDVQFLWLQERVRDKTMKIVKVHTSLNPADLFIKPLIERDMMGHLYRMGVECPMLHLEDRVSMRRHGTSSH